MGGIIFCLNVGLVWLSGLVILGSIVFILFSVFTKELTKRNIVKSSLAFCLSAICIYMIYYAGRYQSMKIDNQTIERLLSISIEEIDLSQYEETEYPRIVDCERHLEQTDGLLSEPYIVISKDKSPKSDEKEYLDNSLKFKIFGKVIFENDKTLILYPRESDRGFSDIYLLSPYGYWNEVCVVDGSYSLSISYLRRKNNDSALEAILDDLQTECVAKKAIG